MVKVKMKKSLKVKEIIKYVKDLTPDRQLEVAEGLRKSRRFVLPLQLNPKSQGEVAFRTLSKSRPTAPSDHASNFVNVGKGFLVPASKGVN